MGTQQVMSGFGGGELRAFMKHLLVDLRALESMLAGGRFESGVRRIGAEQEIFLVDSAWRPAPLSQEVLEDLADEKFTTELARFNLEFNMDPLLFGGDCLRRMERQADELLARAREAAARHGAHVLLTGILPTLHKSDLDLSNMTDKPRYAALNEAMTRLRGSAYEFRMQGTDEISFKHYSVMLEACNTSFQAHFQVGAEEFARLYNLAQAVTAPVLAAATNSPLLFGKRLWRETRIALFQQSVDTRHTGPHLRQVSPRVNFGEHWIEGSVLEIFQEDIARFRVLLGTEIDEDPCEMLKEGRIPHLKALRLHNSTIYRWNRPCYGVSEGKPHLRIENRVLPAGPTPLDEVANAAFWFGLMAGLSAEHHDITEVMDFDHAKANFFAAARLGLDANITWTRGRKCPAQELICKELLPLAREGLRSSGIDAADIERYLDLIEERVSSGRTGSSWLLESLASMKDAGKKGEHLGALTAATVKRQQEGKPGHLWEPARIEEAGGWKHNYQRVEQYMATDLFTVDQDEIIDLVANLMHWKHIRHVPVEDLEHRLVGLVSYRSLLRHLANGTITGRNEPISVSEVMEKNLVTVTPETPSLEAIELMRRHGIGCLPVIKDDRLVGLVTEHDFVDAARQLLEEFLDYPDEE
ncbi:MAG: glutamate-cysteine ligase family protein [Planctomycetota bacterium]